MKPICPAFRTILCALAIAAATTVASATTITYFGFNTVASGDDSYQLGNTPWQLTLNLNDPLVDLSGGGFSNYTPSAVTMTIDGAIRPSAPALTPLSFLLVVNGPSQSGYGNVFYNFWVDSNSNPVGFTIRSINVSSSNNRMKSR